MILTYKYRLKDRSASKILRQHAFAANQVWNYCNAVQRDAEGRYRAGAPRRRWPTHFDLTKLTAGTSGELGITANSINRVCKQFASARDKAKHSLKFRASAGPRRALGWIPFRHDDYQPDGNSILYLRKRFRWFGNKRRPLPAITKGGAFVEDARGRWWVAFVVEVEGIVSGATGEVGIDLGLKTLAILSDGTQIEALQHYRQHEAKLAAAQRAGNKRRVKAIHAKIANCRRDHIHKATTKIARENAVIIVGNVNSAKLAKTRMAKSVLDAGWTMFRNALAYKARRHQAHYEEINEAFTTVTCSACSSRSGPTGQKGLRIREWTCGDCGAVHDRDHNSALNILARSTARPVEASRQVGRMGADTMKGDE